MAKVVADLVAGVGNLEGERKGPSKASFDSKSRKKWEKWAKRAQVAESLGGLADIGSSETDTRKATDRHPGGISFKRTGGNTELQ